MSIEDNGHIDGQQCEEECDRCDDQMYDDLMDIQEAAATGN